MAKTKIDGIKLKEAIDQFGSLQKAMKSLESKKEALEYEVSKRKKENHQLKLEKDKFVSDIEDLKKQFDKEKKKLESLANNVTKWERQYNLFQSFIAMLLSSPSVGTSLKSLMSLLEELDKSGWAMTKTLNDLRGHFVSTVMGDYLKCFRCKVCGAKFMVNKEPHYKSVSNYYYCPACHTSYGVEPDDSFLKAMVSEEQLENTRRIGELEKENDALRPLKAFSNLPCEVCGQPITEWTEHDVWRGVNGLGWGHTECWNTTKGQAKQFAKLVKEELERRTRGYF